MKARRPKPGESRLESKVTRATSYGTGWVGRSLAYVVVGSFLFALCSPARAQGEVNSEYRLKLAFLYNFAQFVQWPADAFRDSGAPLTICVAGDNPFQGDIQQSLRGRTVAGHPVEVKNLNPHEDLRGCQMIFVRAAEMKANPGILAGARRSSTLTVGEAKGFAERGGIINLMREENKLRFEVNIDAAAQTRLRISSKLLALAKIIKE